MSLSVFLTALNDQLVIRVGRSGTETRGTVRKTLRSDDVSVGTTEEGEPVYVRVRNAQAGDNTMRAIREKVISNQPLTATQNEYVVAFALVKMADVLARHRKVELPMPRSQRFDMPEVSDSRWRKLAHA